MRPCFGQRLNVDKVRKLTTSRIFNISVRVYECIYTRSKSIKIVELSSINYREPFLVSSMSDRLLRYFLRRGQFSRVRAIFRATLRRTRGRPRVLPAGSDRCLTARQHCVQQIRDYRGRSNE